MTGIASAKFAVTHAVLEQTELIVDQWKGKE